LKIDGNQIYELSHKYSVQSFPTFVYIKPNTRGMKGVTFDQDRTYQSMKYWMQEMLSDLHPKER
jgi:hypothetical protein